MIVANLNHIRVIILIVDIQEYLTISTSPREKGVSRPAEQTDRQFDMQEL